MRKQQSWIRQQLICCFIHSYTQAHHFPPTVREIGAWVGCPGMRSLQLVLADLERQEYLTRIPHRRRSIVLTVKGTAVAERWQLLVPIDGTDVSTPQGPGAAFWPLTFSRGLRSMTCLPNGMLHLRARTRWGLQHATDAAIPLA